MLDWRIRRARIVDGSGSPWFHGEVGIRDGRIVAVGHVGDARASRELDAGDRCLAPSFIDAYTGSKPHPRSYGTFTRVLGEYVRDKKVLSLEEAVRKMTAFPAARFGLWDRGLIRPGQVADLVLFDPKRIRDAATFEDPHRYSEGVAWVMVGGQIVWQDGQDTGAATGQVLRSGMR